MNVYEVKNGLFARLERQAEPDALLQTVQLFADFFSLAVQTHPRDVLIWAQDLQEQIIYRYSDPDQIRLDKNRLVARIFGVLYDISERLRETLYRLVGLVTV